MWSGRQPIRNRYDLPQCDRSRHRDRRVDRCRSRTACTRAGRQRSGGSTEYGRLRHAGRGRFRHDSVEPVVLPDRHASAGAASDAPSLETRRLPLHALVRVGLGRRAAEPIDDAADSVAGDEIRGCVVLGLLERRAGRYPPTAQGGAPTGHPDEITVFWVGSTYADRGGVGVGGDKGRLHGSPGGAYPRESVHTFARSATGTPSDRVTTAPSLTTRPHSSAFASRPAFGNAASAKSASPDLARSLWREDRP